MNNLEATVAELNNKQAHLMLMVENFKLLNRSARKEIIAYLNIYFANPFAIDTPVQKLITVKIGN